MAAKQEFTPVLDIVVCGNDVGPNDREIEKGITAALAYAEANGLTVLEMVLDEHHRSEAESKALEAAFSGWLHWPASALLVSRGP